MTDKGDAIENPALASRLRTSAVLLEAVTGHAGERISLRELIGRLGDRVYGLLLLILALPNTLPTIPGFSTVFGLLMVLVAVQMAIGLRCPWIPEFLLRKSFPHAEFTRFMTRALPYLQRLERFLKPRWPFFTTPPVERLLGILFVLLAIAIALPIPFGNWLPAILIITAALGLTERDGIVLAVSAALGGIVLLLFASLIIGATGSLPL